MANKRGKAVDTTYLSLDHAEARGFIHRDYLAHCLRWSHVVKHLTQHKRHLTHRVLEVGCGREAPLPKLLYSSRLTHTTGEYVGVDYGPIDWSPPLSEKFKCTLVQKADFLAVPLQGQFDTAVSFEVMEHVEPLHTFGMLKKVRGLLKPDGRFLVSTPCYDPKVGAADNHVNEMTYLAFGALLKLAGFSVEAAYGTFASQKDYKKDMDEAQEAMFDRLSEYYDSSLVSCIFAPLFPDKSRNVIWRVKPADPEVPDGPWFAELANPLNSNSAKWPDAVREIEAQVTRNTVPAEPAKKPAKGKKSK